MASWNTWSMCSIVKITCWKFRYIAYHLRRKIFHFLMKRNINMGVLEDAHVVKNEFDASTTD